MEQVFVADSDVVSATLLVSALREERFDCQVLDPVAPLRNVPQVLLLAIDLLGAERLRALREDPNTQNLPVIAYSGNSQDRIHALELGADDYVSQPLSVREVALRIRALLRRAGRTMMPLRRTAGDITIDRGRRDVQIADRHYHLTQVETRLLHALVSVNGAVLDRQTLLRRVWSDEGLDVRCVDTHIRRLRLKLGPDAARIETVRGRGYRLRSDAAQLPPR